MKKSITKPTYYNGYDVKETKTGKVWTRIATAWPLRNGKDGFTVELRALPLSGSIVFLPPEPKDKKADTPASTPTPEVK